ncbi:XRE family transcriptional regulator [Hymenobacter sp. B1770]|uniref:XRE family transcriptional regulator n=1 Tax=Hymenobacter sp. B1770 TaxID=1718788 RepID=UPI003CEB88EC
MEKHTIGSTILQLRKKAKLTQWQLAESVGVSGAAISHFENGTSKPSAETVEKLTQVLGFDFSTLEVEPKRLKWHGSADDLEALLNGVTLTSFPLTSRRPENLSCVTPTYPNHLSNTVGLVMYNQPGFINSILESNPVLLKNTQKYQVSVLPLLGIDYQQAVVLEVQGSSMAPRYPEGSRYVLFPVYEEHWQYATGVHAIWLKSKKLLIKRITSNKEGTITLKSDATGDETTVEVGDIAALWRFGQAIHLPPEEL